MQMFFNNNQVYLKVKAKSLAEEARIIKKEEQKISKDIYYFEDDVRKTNNEIHYLHSMLHQHRVEDVRREARATHLARAFLRGKPASFVEPKVDTSNPYEMKKLKERFVRIATKYYQGSRVFNGSKKNEDRVKLAERWIDHHLNFK